MLLDATREFFRTAGWVVETASDQPIVRAQYGAGDLKWLVYAFADEPRHQLIVFSVHPEQAPVERRAALAELFMRIDFQLPVGNFELDFGDGTMRFRTSFDFDEIRPTQVMVRNLVLTNVAAMGRFAPAIAKVLGGASPEAALTA